MNTPHPELSADRLALSGGEREALSEAIEVVQAKVARMDAIDSEHDGYRHKDAQLEAREGCFILIRQHGAALRRLTAAPGD